MTDDFDVLAAALNRQQVRFVVMGVWGANYYASTTATIFTTQDRDLFLPLDPENLLAAWKICRDLGLDLWCGDEPLGEPMDRFLAERIVEHRALVRATGPQGLQVDLTLVMAGFDFETVFRERRTFLVSGVEIPVARLAHIVSSKEAAGRPKDLLFLASYQEALEQLLGRE